MYGHAADPEGLRDGFNLVHGLPPVQLMREMFLWHAGWCGKECRNPPIGRGPVSSEPGTRQIWP
eukprot:5158127-Pyramimonas_sp.AAC.1